MAIGDNRIKYELSVWQDITPNGGVNSPHFDEVKLAVIGSSEMDTPIKAYNVTEKQQISGADTLTFNMVRKYMRDGELVDNPFVGLLNNETKIKLRIGEPYSLIDANGEYDSAAAQEEDANEIWQDYILKKVDADKNSYVNTYTCDAAFPAELGRNGWSVVLDTELENNYGTLGELTNKVLEKTGITCSGELEPTEKLTEQLFAYQLETDLTATNTMNSEDTITILTGDIIYFFYSGVTIDSGNWIVKDAATQILYRSTPFTIEDCDDNYIVVDYANRYQYDIDNSLAGEIVYPVGSINDPAETGYAIQGKRIVKNWMSHFEPVADKYVYDYKFIGDNPSVVGGGNDLQTGNTVFAYDETKYYTTGVVQNYVTNHVGFRDLIGWRPNDIDLIQVWPKVMPGNTTDIPHLDSPINYLRFMKKGVYYNLGLENLSFIKDDIYVIRVKARKLNAAILGYQDNARVMPASINTNTTTLNGFKFNIGICDPEDEDNPITMSFLQDAQNGVDLTFTPNTTLWDDDDPNRPEGEPPFDIEKLSYGFPAIANARTCFTGNDNELNQFYNDDQGYAYAFIKINATSTASQKPQFIIQLTQDIQPEPVEPGSTERWYYPWHIQDIQFFKYVEDDKGAPVFPDDIPLSYAKTTRHFYYITSGQKIKELSSDPQYYEQLMRPNYAAVRNITVSESNYFNIINSLAELFEVWVRFKLYHTKDGHILFNEDGPVREIIYSEYAPYDEYNWAGFRYRQNLANIKKNIDSAEISTKMIVKNNSNEYATDGICSITRAINNPSGENILYNFDYYINIGLLDNAQVTADLYGLEEGNLGYYPKMKALNDELLPLNERINATTTALLRAREMHNYASISYDSALEEYRKTLEKYRTYESISTATEKQILWQAVVEAKAKMDQFERDKLQYEQQILEYEILLYGNVQLDDAENTKPYYKGEFDNQTTYSIGDVVIYKNNLYCLINKPNYLTWYATVTATDADGPSRPPGPYGKQRS